MILEQNNINKIFLYWCWIFLRMVTWCEKEKQTNRKHMLFRKRFVSSLIVSLSVLPKRQQCILYQTDLNSLPSHTLKSCQLWTLSCILNWRVLLFQELTALWKQQTMFSVVSFSFFNYPRKFKFPALYTVTLVKFLSVAFCMVMLLFSLKWIWVSRSIRHSLC